MVGSVTRYFDAFLAREVNVVRLGEDDYALYAAGRRNSFGTCLAARGTREEIEAELRRVRMA